MQRYTVYLVWKLLNIFRVEPSPIIRSADYCIYSICYLSHCYCCLPLSWKSWNWFECAVGGVRQPQHRNRRIQSTVTNRRIQSTVTNRRIQSTVTNLASLRSVLLLSSVLRLGVPNGLPFASSWTTTCHAFAVYRMQAEYSVHLNRLRVSPS
jgi:hypothetical protein